MINGNFWVVLKKAHIIVIVVVTRESDIVKTSKGRLIQKRESRKLGKNSGNPFFERFEVCSLFGKNRIFKYEGIFYRLLGFRCRRTRTPF